MRVFIDTGAFLALADASDSSHEDVSLTYQDMLEQGAALYTSNFIIDEAVTLIRARVNHRAAVAFLKNLDISGVKALRVTEEDERAAREIFIKYKDKDFSYTDCTSFFLIEKLGIDAVLTLDEHFRQYNFKRAVNRLLL